MENFKKGEENFPNATQFPSSARFTSPIQLPHPCSRYVFAARCPWVVGHTERHNRKNKISRMLARGLMLAGRILATRLVFFLFFLFVLTGHAAHPVCTPLVVRPLKTETECVTAFRYRSTKNTLRPSGAPIKQPLWTGVCISNFSMLCTPRMRSFRASMRLHGNNLCISWTIGPCELRDPLLAFFLYF